MRSDGASALARFAPLAPQWLVQVVAQKPNPVPWPDMVRAACSIGVPLAVGLAAGLGPATGFAAMGSLVGAFGDAGGRFSARFTRAGFGIVAGAIGLLAGRLLLTHGPLLAVPVVGLFAVLSALVSSISAPLSFAGLQLLLYLAIASGPAQLEPPLLLLGLFASGAAWSVLLSLVQSVVLPSRDEPGRALVAVLDDLIALLRALDERAAPPGLLEKVLPWRHPAPPPDPALDAGRSLLSAAIGRAYDAVATARAHSSGRRSDLRRINAMLAAATRLAAVAIDTARTHPEQVVAAIPDIVALRDRIAAGEWRAPRRPVTSTSPVMRALDQLDRAGESPATAAIPTVRRRRPLGELLTGSRTWLFAARLAITLMVAEVAQQLLPIAHPYWVLLTAAVVLKPDLGSVFARGVQRTVGTMIGVVLGAGVLAVVPAGPLLLIPATLFAFLFPFGASRNYGMLAVFVSPLVLLLTDLGGTGTAGVAASRLLDTAIGAAVVLLVGYLPWPTTWRTDLERDVAAAADALAGYAEAGFTGDPVTVVPARRRAFRAVADARAELQSALAEPTRRARQASAWYPLVSQLDRVADSLRDASIIESRVTAEPIGDAPRQVAAALRELAGAIRHGRTPAALPLPDRGALADAAEDVAAARRMIVGPGGDRD